MKLRTRQVLLILVSLTLFVAGVYVYVFNSVVHTSGAIAQLRSDLSYEVERKARISSVAAVIEDTAGEREKIISYFGTRDEVVGLIAAFEELGRLAGVSPDVSSVTIQESDESDTYARLVLQMRTVGTWGQTRHFLSLIEAFPRAARVTTANLNTAGEEGLWAGAFVIEMLMHDETL